MSAQGALVLGNQRVAESPFPEQLHFLHDPEHPATSWLLWGKAPLSSYGPPKADGSAGSSTGNVHLGVTDESGLNAETDPIRSAPVRGIVHHAVTFVGGGGFGMENGRAPENRADLLWVCNHEIAAQKNPATRLCLGYVLGGAEALNNNLVNTSFGAEKLTAPTRDQHDPTFPGIAAVDPHQAPRRRFVAFLEPTSTSNVCLTIVAQDVAIIEVSYAENHPCAPKINGASCLSCIYMIQDRCLSILKAVSMSCTILCYTLSQLHGQCPSCLSSTPGCLCGLQQRVMRNCTSFRDMAARLHHGSVGWLPPRGELRLFTWSSASPSAPLTEGRLGIRVQHFDGFGENPETVSLRQKYFSCTGMLLSSPLIAQPSLPSTDTPALPSCSGTNSDAKSSSVPLVEKAGPDLYSCPQCSKAFGRKSGLQRHKRTVHGPRRHQCEICGSLFQQGAHLKTHQVLVHTKSLDYECELCNMKFPLKSRLTAHMRNKHPGDPSEEPDE